MQYISLIGLNVFLFDFIVIFLLYAFTPGFCSVMCFCLVKVSFYLQTCEAQQERREVWEWSALPGNSRKHFRLCFIDCTTQHCVFWRKQLHDFFAVLSVAGPLHVPAFLLHTLEASEDPLGSAPDWWLECVLASTDGAGQLLCLLKTDFQNFHCVVYMFQNNILRFIDLKCHWHSAPGWFGTARTHLSSSFTWLLSPLTSVNGVFFGLCRFNNSEFGVQTGFCTGDCKKVNLADWLFFCKVMLGCQVKFGSSKTAQMGPLCQRHFLLFTIQEILKTIKSRNIFNAQL